MSNVNPASLLHDRLTGWAVTPSSQSPAALRSVDGNWVEPHLEAISWALAVREHLGALNGRDNVDDQEFVGALLEAIFTAQGLQTSGRDQRHISKQDLRALRLLGAQWSSPLSVDAHLLADIQGIAGEAEDLVQTSTYLSDNERHYLLEVSQHLTKAIDEVTVFGTANVHRLANELAGALTVYLSQAGDGEADKALGLVKRLTFAVKNNLPTVSIAALTGIASGAGEQAIAAILQ